MSTKTAFHAIIASALLAASYAYAQSGESVEMGFTTVAQTLENDGGPFTGQVAAGCKGGQGLGGAQGTITESTTKGTPGGGPCNSNIVVTGSVWSRDSPQTPCASAEITRPNEGWMNLIHHAYFSSVIATGGKVVCSMGGS
jgi:hypothetical protein